jgi:hypothetical protein
LLPRIPSGACACGLRRPRLPPQVFFCAGLLCRRDWVLDEEYTQRYMGSAPPGTRRAYNDLYNEALQRPGWRHYQSPELCMKPVLSAALAYTFDATEVCSCEVLPVCGGNP